MTNTITNRQKPKIRLHQTDGYKFVNEVVQENQLNTVCEEARCPNIYECWDRRTATIMILGDICTRACSFCNVKTGKPDTVDIFEPFKIAKTVKELELEHVVITSVDRDDLPDGGAKHFVDVINCLRKESFGSSSPSPIIGKVALSKTT